MSTNTGVFHNPKVRDSVEQAIREISSWFKAFAMLLGIICANVLDVAIGGLALSLLFKDIDFWRGSPTDGYIVGFTLSMALLFFQYVLWDKVLIGGLETKDIPLILFASIVLFLDSNLDVSPVMGWMHNSTLVAQWNNVNSPFPWWDSLADMVVFSTTWAVYLVLALGELFTAIYIKGFKKSTKKKRKPAYTRSRPQPSYETA